jgi:hypothetical protein
MTSESPIPSWNQTGNTDPVRTAVRFPIHVAVRLKTGSGDDIEATTENISANGLLFTCDPLPKVDSRIEFTILMPASVMGTTEDVSIQCTGRVVRHEAHGEGMKAAAIIDEYLLKA